MKQQALFRINEGGITYVPIDRFSEREKGLQKFVSSHLEEILDVHFIKNEAFVSDNKEYDEVEQSKSQNGRIDTFGITANGTPVVIEYKERTSKAIVDQAIRYLMLSYEPQNDPQKIIDVYFSEEEQGKFSIPKVTKFYRKKGILIAKEYDENAAFVINSGSNFEIMLKEYCLFKERLGNITARYMWLADAPTPQDLINRIKCQLPQNPIGCDPRGNGNGFFLEYGGKFVIPKKVKSEDAEIDIINIISKMATEIYQACYYGNVENIPNVMVEETGHVSVIVHGDLNAGLRNIAQLEKKWETLENIVSSEVKKAPKLNKKPNLIYINESPESKTLKVLDKIRYHGKTTIEPVTFNVYKWGGEFFVLMRPIITDTDFMTYPGKKKIYREDQYTRHIRDVNVRENVFPKLRRAIIRISRDIEEKLTNKNAITYVTPKGKFAQIEPRGEYLSVRLNIPFDDLGLDDATKHAFSFHSDKDRLHVATVGDIKDVISIVKIAYNVKTGK